MFIQTLDSCIKRDQLTMIYPWENRVCTGEVDGNAGIVEHREEHVAT